MKTMFQIRTLITVFVCTSIFIFSFPLSIYSQGDECSGALLITSSSAGCFFSGNGTYSLSGATASTVPAGCASAGTHRDVWFSFVATNTTHSITLGSIGSSIVSPEIQLYSGICTALVSMQCSNTPSINPTLTATGLTIGNTYYIRVSHMGSALSGGSPTNKFDICLTNPPANDDCGGAISLIAATTCSNTSGAIDLSTASTGLPAGCQSGGTHYDVWYKFVAVKVYEIISISGPGSNFTNPEIQLYSGACGSLTSLQCGSTSITATGLTIGNTYYVRVSNVGIVVANNGGFSICVYHPNSATYDYGKSYVNITRNSGGGTINPGDTLEIRGTLVIRSLTLDSIAFFDTLYNGGGIKLIPGSIALRTNEGKVYKSFTDAFDADAGYSYISGSDTVIRINIGTGSSNVARGRLTNSSKPSVFGSTCIAMATYRVVVYAGYNTPINVGGGIITIKDATTGISGNLSFDTRNAIVYSSPGLCPNAVSATNAIGGDFNGTFGTPTGGTPLAKNRGTSVNVPGYIYSPFSINSPQDYYYGITNNTSGSGTSFTTVTTWAKPDNSSPTHRVFNVWDIIGDHTNATNTAKGNPPCDTTQAVSATNPCGYMLVINSAYKTDTAFQYSVTNLCPNTYYEISAWVRNICYKCSCDSNGVGASGAGYIPFAPNDSSGVQPNLAFDINGTDYFTTGNIPYAGIFPTTQAGSDSTNRWVKRGFTYLTGASQTSFIVTIRNNAPGGGGNDWALDDISLATCLPNMQYSPSLNPIICQLNAQTIYDTVRSYSNNYVYYKWQNSTDGGTTWNDIPGATGGPTAPTWNGSAWEYVTSYTIPNTSTTLTNNGDKYRLIVATTAANLLSGSCVFTDGVSIITANVIDCGPALSTDLLSFNGKLVNNRSSLSWITSKENESFQFNIEKSGDGMNFTKIGTVNGHGNYNTENNYYNFTDPVDISGRAWYRIVMINSEGKKKYSRTIQINNNLVEFGLNNVINPFNHELDFEIVTTESSKIDISLTDMFGKTARKLSLFVYEGVNSVSIPNTERLSSGMYILQISNKEKSISTRVMKK